MQYDEAFRQGFRLGLLGRFLQRPAKQPFQFHFQQFLISGIILFKDRQLSFFPLCFPGSRGRKDWEKVNRKVEEISLLMESIR